MVSMGQFALAWLLTHRPAYKRVPHVVRQRYASVVRDLRIGREQKISARGYRVATVLRLAL